MSQITTKLIVSDLHLADGSSILDCFGERQQAAFDGLIAATLPTREAQVSSPGRLSDTNDLELIINGDCFDFLVTTPYSADGRVEPEGAVQKLERILAAHPAFIETLRTFIGPQGRTVTFIAGNHDIELCFVEVRECICMAITGHSLDERVRFCPTRFYRPLPDVHIEHGNQYDFWNHRTLELWDEQGQPLTLTPQSILLSPGSRYFQQASSAVSLRYAYFDHFEPSINTIRQIAMLCLLDSQLVVETTDATMHLLSSPRHALDKLSLQDRRIPVRLFEEALQDFAVFQMDMLAQEKDWSPLPAQEEQGQVSQETFMEVLATREALTHPPLEAMAALCVPAPYQMAEDVSLGLHNVLKQTPTLRYAIAGHTHMLAIEPNEQSNQEYLNTASWTERLALPSPEEMTPPLFEWLKQPDWQQVPLRDVTQFVFALVTSIDGGPASANLCAWQGGRDGFYRVLSREKE